MNMVLVETLLCKLRPNRSR